MDRHAPPIGLPALLTFLALTACVTALLDTFVVEAGRLDVGRGFPIHSIMWAPGLAAIATCRLFGISLRRLGLSRFAARSVAAGYAVVIGYSVPAFSLLWMLRLAPLDWTAFTVACRKLYDGARGAPLLAIGFTLTFGVVQSGASALGEEIGWRGFLVPALRDRLSLGATMILSGLIWAVWHFPLTLFSEYGSDTPVAFQLLCFTVMIVSTGTIYGLFRLRSGSVWPPVVMHAVHNAAIQWLLDPMTRESGSGAWYAGEFGGGLALVTAIVAIVVYVRRDHLGLHPVEPPAPC